jgi:ABC transporter
MRELPARMTEPVKLLETSGDLNCLCGLLGLDGRVWLVDPHLAGQGRLCGLMSATLVVRGLAVAYGDRSLFRDLDVVVGPGDVIGLVGANGAGKSTLLGVLAGLRPADAGTVTISPPAAMIGHLPQEPDRRPQETVRHGGNKPPDRRSGGPRHQPLRIGLPPQPALVARRHDQSVQPRSAFSRVSLALASGNQWRRQGAY